jgi:hypothetical protein
LLSGGLEGWGTVSNSGTLEIAGDIAIEGRLENTHILEWQSGLPTGAGQVVNYETFRIEVASDGYFDPHVTNEPLALVEHVGVATASFSNLFTNGGDVEIGSDGVLELAGGGTQTGGTTTVSGGLTAFYFDIAGGALTLDNGDVSGPIQVSQTSELNGVGAVNGQVLNAGFVSPGNSPGIITVNGDYAQDITGVLEIEIEGTNPATPQFDQLIVNGTVALDGALNVSILSGFTPAPGDSFTILQNDGDDPIAGQFLGLPAHSILNLGGKRLLIDYAGGDGNDLELKSVLFWDGEGGDFQWNNALNWVGDVVPTAADEVAIGDLALAA